MVRRTPHRPLLLTGLLACAGLCANVNLQAADPAAKTGNTLTLNGGKPTGTLTRDQLRQCLSQQKSIKDQNSEAARAQTELQAQKAEVARQRDELEKEGADLDTERAAIDATKAEAVEAFNSKLVQRRQRLEQHDALIEAYNAKLRPFNEKVQVLDTTRQTWVGECGNRSYDEVDFYAIQRGK